MGLLGQVFNLEDEQGNPEYFGGPRNHSALADLLNQLSGWSQRYPGPGPSDQPDRPMPSGPVRPDSSQVGLPPSRFAGGHVGVGPTMYDPFPRPPRGPDMLRSPSAAPSMPSMPQFMAPTTPLHRMGPPSGKPPPQRDPWHPGMAPYYGNTPRGVSYNPAEGRLGANSLGYDPRDPGRGTPSTGPRIKPGRLW